jgi:hypothetical protein
VNHIVAALYGFINSIWLKEISLNKLELIEIFTESFSERRKLIFILFVSDSASDIK